jgi:hypothetical protein
MFPPEANFVRFPARGRGDLRAARRSPKPWGGPAALIVIIDQRTASDAGVADAVEAGVAGTGLPGASYGFTSWPF